jgi:hypothetical protein
MPPKGSSMSAEQRAKIAAAMRGKRKTKRHRQAIARGVFRHWEATRKGG